MELPPASSRRHDLDALRAFAMLLGIALHAALSFTGGPWIMQDSRTSGVFLVLISAVHGFRMPLFFVLSGFFTAMLWRRRGLRAVIAHRFKRVFLPLLLGTLTIVPLMFWLGAVAAQTETRRIEKGPPTFWKACSAGDRDVVQRLLDNGAEVNAPDPLLGVTPLSYATIFGRDVIVKLLLQRGADGIRCNRPRFMPLAFGHETPAASPPRPVLFALLVLRSLGEGGRRISAEHRHHARR